MLTRTRTRAPIRALRDGILDVPGRAEEEVADLQGSADLVGCTYEGAVAVDATGAFLPYPPGAHVTPTGVAPWSEGLDITDHGERAYNP